MKEIKLTQGEVALVDDEDYDYLIQWRWYLDKDGYARRGGRKNGRPFNYLMHRVILNIINSNLETDHRDHNKLNNQKSNIRICTHAENMRNVIPRGRSKYLGVLYQKYRIMTGNGINIHEYIIARIKIDGKYIKLGHFQTEEEAAKAYDIAAKKYYGEFANLNFKYEL